MGKKVKKSSTKKGGGGGSSDKNASGGGPASSSSSSSPNKKKKGKGNNKRRGKNHNNKSQWGTEEDINFRRNLEADGRYEIMEMAADGNCLFRSLSDQLFQDHGSKHGDVRDAVCTYIEEHEDDFSVFLVLDENEEDEDAADFESYVSTMRQDGEWGGNLELVAAAQLYRRNITVFSANLSALNICHNAKKPSGPDLLLSYHDNDHYSSVRDTTGAATTKSKPLDNDHNQQESSGKAATKKKPKRNAAVSPSEEEPLDDYDSTNLKPDQEIKQSTNAPPPRKNALCHCGSGKKYKKCCWADERREARIRKMKGSDDYSTKDTNKSSDEVFEMNGNFRVLQI